MKTALHAAGVVALAALVFVLARVYVFVGDADAAVRHTDAAVVHVDSDRAELAAKAEAVLDGGAAAARAATGTLTAATARVQAFAPLEDKAAATLDRVNKPCSGSGSDVFACGTLAEANVLMRKGSDVIVTTQRNEDKETRLLDEKLSPLLDSAAALVRDPAVPEILGNVQASTASLDSMLKTTDAVETKATAGYLHPSHNPFVRTWRAVAPFLLPAAEIAAAAK